MSMAAGSCKRDGERRRERDDAADPCEGQDEHLLPGQGWILAANRWNKPAREIGRRIDPDEAGDDHYRADDRDRDGQLGQSIIANAVDQCARLQAGNEEHQAFDQVKSQKKMPCNRVSALMRRSPFQLM
jgi:hypothetical protein